MTLSALGHPGAAGGVRHKRFSPAKGWKGTCARGQIVTNEVSSSSSA